jgi:hypothetical protein
MHMVRPANMTPLAEEDYLKYYKDYDGQPLACITTGEEAEESE